MFDQRDYLETVIETLKRYIEEEREIWEYLNPPETTYDSRNHWDSIDRKQYQLDLATALLSLLNTIQERAEDPTEPVSLPDVITTISGSLWFTQHYADAFDTTTAPGNNNNPGA